MGLLPREGTAADIVWIDVPISYAYHPLNAYDRPDGSVVIDLCVYDKMFDQDRNGPFGDGLARLERWEVNLALRKTSVAVIDASGQEFPRHAHRVGTKEHRYGYCAEVLPDGAGSYAFGATLKHDLATGQRTSFGYGPGRGGGEPAFVAREGSTAEDDGWLMAFSYANDGSEASFVLLDAQDVARGPIAEVKLPQRVPYGFHGNWVSDRAVAPGA